MIRLPSSRWKMGVLLAGCLAAFCVGFSRDRRPARPVPPPPSAVAAPTPASLPNPPDAPAKPSPFGALERPPRVIRANHTVSPAAPPVPAQSRVDPRLYLAELEKAYRDVFAK